MPKIVLEISGVLSDKLARTRRPVTLTGTGFVIEASDGDPPVISGGPIDPYPDIGLPERPPHVSGGPIDPYPDGGLPPIVPVPPNAPNVPPPGSPPVIVQGTHPVNPMVPPAAVMMEYPGIGKTIVPQPTATAAAPT